jgi:hypothetical protein
MAMTGQERTRRVGLGWQLQLEQDYPQALWCHASLPRERQPPRVGRGRPGGGWRPAYRSVSCTLREAITATASTSTGRCRAKRTWPDPDPRWHSARNLACSRSLSVDA